jgi:hypothetical protein
MRQTATNNALNGAGHPASNHDESLTDDSLGGGGFAAIEKFSASRSVTDAAWFSNSNFYFKLGSREIAQKKQLAQSKADLFGNVGLS